MSTTKTVTTSESSDLSEISSDSDDYDEYENDEKTTVNTAKIDKISPDCIKSTTSMPDKATQQLINRDILTETICFVQNRNNSWRKLKYNESHAIFSDDIQQQITDIISAYPDIYLVNLLIVLTNHYDEICNTTSENPINMEIFADIVKYSAWELHTNMDEFRHREVPKATIQLVIDKVNKKYRTDPLDYKKSIASGILSRIHTKIHTISEHDHEAEIEKQDKIDTEAEIDQYINNDEFVQLQRDAVDRMKAKKEAKAKAEAERLEQMKQQLDKTVLEPGALHYHYIFGQLHLRAEYQQLYSIQAFLDHEISEEGFVKYVQDIVSDQFSERVYDMLVKLESCSYSLFDKYVLSIVMQKYHNLEALRLLTSYECYNYMKFHNQARETDGKLTGWVINLTKDNIIRHLDAISSYGVSTPNKKKTYYAAPFVDRLYQLYRIIDIDNELKTYNDSNNVFTADNNADIDRIIDHIESTYDAPMVQTMSKGLHIYCLNCDPYYVEAILLKERPMPSFVFEREVKINSLLKDCKLDPHADVDVITTAEHIAGNNITCYGSKALKYKQRCNPCTNITQEYSFCDSATGRSYGSYTRLGGNNAKWHRYDKILKTVLILLYEPSDESLSQVLAYVNQPLDKNLIQSAITKSKNKVKESIFNTTALDPDAPVLTDEAVDSIIDSLSYVNPSDSLTIHRSATSGLCNAFWLACAEKCLTSQQKSRLNNEGFSKFLTPNAKIRIVDHNESSNFTSQDTSATKLLKSLLVKIVGEDVFNQELNPYFKACLNYRKSSSTYVSRREYKTDFAVYDIDLKDPFTVDDMVGKYQSLGAYLNYTPFIKPDAINPYVMQNKSLIKSDITRVLKCTDAEGGMLYVKELNSLTNEYQLTAYSKKNCESTLKTKYIGTEVKVSVFESKPYQAMLTEYKNTTDAAKKLVLERQLRDYLDSKVTKVSVYTYYSEIDVQQIICKKGITYYSKNEDVYSLFRGYNWDNNRASELETAEQYLEPWINHVKLNICQNNEYYFYYLMEWWHEIITDPIRKTKIIIEIVGGQGTGKNTFVDPCLALFGRYALTNVTNIKILTGRFNCADVGGTHVSCINELEHNSKEYNALKSKASEHYTVPEYKGRDVTGSALSVNNYTILTNYVDTLAIDGDDRRFFVLQTRKVPNPKEHFRIIYDLMKNKDDTFNPVFLQHLFTYLYHTDFRAIALKKGTENRKDWTINFNEPAPATSFKKDMVALQYTFFDQFVGDHFKYIVDGITEKNFYEKYKKEWTNQYGNTNGKIPECNQLMTLEQVCSKLCGDTSVNGFGVARKYQTKINGVNKRCLRIPPKDLNDSKFDKLRELHERFGDGVYTTSIDLSAADDIPELDDDDTDEDKVNIIINWCKELASVMKLDTQQFIEQWSDLKQRLQKIDIPAAAETIEKYSKVFEK